MPDQLLNLLKIFLLLLLYLFFLRVLRAVWAEVNPPKRVEAPASKPKKERSRRSAGRKHGPPALRVVAPAGFTKVSALGVEEERVRGLVDIVSPPDQWASLGDGYRVEAAFVLWEGKRLLLAPTSALFRRGDGWALYVADDGRARLKEVTIGQRNGLSAEIRSGLNAGDRVIAHPDEKILDGTRVKARTN